MASLRLSGNYLILPRQSMKPSGVGASDQHSHLREPVRLRRTANALTRIAFTSASQHLAPYISGGSQLLAGHAGCLTFLPRTARPLRVMRLLIHLWLIYLAYIKSTPVCVCFTYSSSAFCTRAIAAASVRSLVGEQTSTPPAACILGCVGGRGH
ncbi:uncharacterized protein LAESUDRAFT_64165 [Laetiporus sulphureus 93-53]|uniref:Uncharacterized protein n=1 Tax=Laetiporus sulphureus 93-53 TaxID=1314785 RepID=A0A165F4I1_9APHY|nr:uncharacterized protein LAESUDRAFT_64165 [Laetiporus sulphureus 93-53]KZT08370.1 hypothetical protein LAESUDRAFT_64165 [Laetiporus sulphureus 93-53]